jgi:hypothetical protein
VAVAVATFSTFAALLVAAGKLAADSAILNWRQALADLAADPGALAAALRDAGLTPLAHEMARQAEEVALHFTHPGRARDDAIAVFWQVAPAAFDAGAALDPDRMVAAIRSSPHAGDFAATVLAEPLFRAVARQALAVMRADPAFAATTPARWRETLRRHGVRLELGPGPA